MPFDLQAEKKIISLRKRELFGIDLSKCAGIFKLTDHDMYLLSGDSNSEIFEFPQANNDWLEIFF